MSECNEIIDSLPRWTEASLPPRTAPNAHVFIDDIGRLNILPVDGGWLGIEPKDFVILRADAAPFSD